jgi:hypothetical protein
MDLKMLSRVGKSTDQMYSVFKKKEQDTIQPQKPILLSHNKSPDSFFTRKLLQNFKTNGKRKKYKVLHPVEVQPAKWATFRTISRGTYYKVNSDRNPPPPCGHYNINYDLVDRPLGNLKMKHKKSKPRKKAKFTQPGLRHVQSVDRIKGFIDFTKQSPRSLYEKMQIKNDPHEKRFEWAPSLQHTYDQNTSTCYKSFGVLPSIKKLNSKPALNISSTKKLKRPILAKLQ